MFDKLQILVPRLCLRTQGDRGPASTRGTRSRGLGFGLPGTTQSVLAACVFLAAAAASAAESVSTLHLSNGGLVPGTLEASAAPARLRWQSPLFVSPFDFEIDSINAAHFPLPDKLPRPAGEFCFELTGGDVLFGALAGMTADELTIQDTRLGLLHVKKSAVQRLYRWHDNADLVYLGPNGLAEWKASSPAGGWREEFGQLMSDQEGAVLGGDLHLPARAVVEFELSWNRKPDFVLALGVGSDDKSFQHAFRLEVWDSDLVVQRELEQQADVASVQKIGSGPGRAQFSVYLDQERGHCIVVSATGERLAELKVAEGNPTPLGGLRLVNRRGILRLERLRISRWSAELPASVQIDKPRLQLKDGTVVYGSVALLDPASREFVVREKTGESRVPFDKAETAFFGTAADSDARSLRAVCLDGSQLSGELSKVADGAVWVQSPGIKEPLRLPMAGLRSLIVLRNESPAAPSDEGPLGVLEVEGLRLRGGLVEGVAQPGASCLVWRPLGSSVGAALRSGISGRIVFREPPKARTSSNAAQPGMPKAAVKRVVVQNGVVVSGTTKANAASARRPRSLYLRTGDMIPCDVTAIDEKGVTFQSTMTDATFVAHEKIKAVELVSDAPNAIKLTKAKRERLLMLPRMQKDNPPTHLVRSRNGDYLRGRIIEMDDQKLRIEVRLETKEVPRDRVAQIIWLHPDELDGAKAGEGPAEDEGQGTRVQVLRNDGVRLTFVAEQLADASLAGTSDVLGACRVELNRIDQLMIGGGIEAAAAELAYAQWKLHHAPEPKFVTADSSGSREGGSTGMESALVGKPAPLFDLDLLTGEKFRLADRKGKIVVLDFWATWCGPCIQSLPLVEAAARDFANDGVELVAVNLEEAPKQIKSLLERQKLELTVALDRDGVVAEKYQATAIPQTVVIDREGNIHRLFIGGGPKIGDQIRDVLRALISPADPAKNDAAEQPAGSKE